VSARPTTPVAPLAQAVGSVNAPRIRAVAGVCFLLLLGLWTWKLLEPSPVPESLRHSLASIADLLPFLAAKSLHAGGYALLAALAWIWAPSRAARSVAVAFLMLHAVGTEIGQTYVPNRTGRASDVLIDWIGIGLGVLIARHIWRQ